MDGFQHPSDSSLQVWGRDDSYCRVRDSCRGRDPAKPADWGSLTVIAGGVIKQDS